MPQEFRIAHWSDLHVTDGPRLPEQRELALRIVDQISEHDVDLILITGDLAGRTVPHRTTIGERGVLFELITSSAALAPVLILTGNHDVDLENRLLRYLSGGFPIHVLSKAGTMELRAGMQTAKVYWLAHPTKSWMLRDSKVRGVDAVREAIEERLSTLVDAWAVEIDDSPDDVVNVFAGHFLVHGSTTGGGEVLSGTEIGLNRFQLGRLAVDYGAHGHIHKRQHIIGNHHYVGTPWPSDFGDAGRKGWHLVCIDAGQTRVEFIDSCAPPLTTLEYTWDGNGWGDRPSAEHARGAHVRMILRSSQQHVDLCPWAVEVEAISQVALSVKQQKLVAPVVRVRAPVVAKAHGTENKVRAYWSTLENPPFDDEADDAAAMLGRLRSESDESIANSWA